MKKRKVEQSAFFTTLLACQICFISFFGGKKRKKKEKKSWARAKVAACKVLQFPMGEIPYPAKLAFLFVSQHLEMSDLSQVGCILLEEKTRLKQILVRSSLNTNFELLSSSWDCLRISVIRYK